MSRRAPLIGVSTSITVGASPERAYVNSAYLHAVQQAGGVPVPLPPQLSAASLQRLGAELHGLLLTGGGDVDPALFGQAPHATLYDVAPSRDTLETSVLNLALGRGVPVLAVCRGIQVLNVALGGTLYQDVATEPGTQIPHSQKEPRDQPTHKVKVTPGSRLAEILGADELEVNSMHHQAIHRLGRGLTAVAWGPDQLVEGAEIDDPARFVLGVQWHPEELVGHSEPARRLFSALVAAARKS
ncbi:MAG TPA: gamma-glutamyl-gamma-aminobutyrate hydrolase family protein [Candidatus Acidoferrum sp.]|nr:gamma-glutamyl-gamma-aminobutyrate hydrolase family protein [Candidatus Acidoferrum sp.]